MNNTLDELKYYCNEKNTFGALLLTGPWGCGKTYLISHQLCEDEKLQSTHAFLKISLFGEPSIESIRKKVKSEYLAYKLSNGEYKKLPKAFGHLNSFIDFIKSTGKLGSVANAVLSIDPTDFIEVTNQISGKEVILIFDDFERSGISTVNLLGCINEYCENNKIKVIIVANEDKMFDNTAPSPEPSRMKYSDIKEKIVARTIHYSPQYTEIIHNIIDSFQISDTDNSGYKGFLQKNEKQICDMFCNGEIKNLRSLKCGLQDFQRVYKIYSKMDYMSQIADILISFLIFSLECKAGNITESKSYGLVLSETHIDNDFPESHHAALLPASVKDWAYSGKWDESQLIEEIKQKKLLDSPLQPKDKLRLSFLLDVTEEDIKAGFNDLIHEAYQGSITLNDYVLLIENFAFARKIKYKFPQKVNYNDLLEGVRKCIQRLLNSCDTKNFYNAAISSENLNELSEDEASIYQIIEDFRNEDVYILNANKTAYLDALNKHDFSKICNCENKRYKAFDIVMSEAVFSHYEWLPSSDRRAFISIFFETWRGHLTSIDLSPDTTRLGLEDLLSKLNQLNRTSVIEKYIDQIFEEKISTLISSLPSTNSDR